MLERRFLCKLEALPARLKYPKLNEDSFRPVDIINAPVFLRLMGIPQFAIVCRFKFPTGA